MARLTDAERDEALSILQQLGLDEWQALDALAALVQLSESEEERHERETREALQRAWR